MAKTKKTSKRVKQLTPEQIIANAEKAEVNPPAKNASAVQKGAIYAVMAGRPSKPAVIRVFGKGGYALSWVARAIKMGITPEELCERFKTDPAGVKTAWAAATEKKATTAPS